MSSKTKAKRSAPASNPPADGDHRKRRRNRTTQSCLNCHTSKRMCDRKRPACARCTQLGFTGLCVYEIDDPSQRSESQDETARLLKRVADLESIIRELKNKPHPRWSQSASNQADRLHSRPHLGDGIESQDLSSKASSPRTSSESGESFLIERPSTRSSTAKSSNTYPSSPILLSSCRPSSQYYASSPQSTPSPSFLTPTEEYIHPHVTTATQLDISFDHDLSSMFLSTYPNLITAGGYRMLKTDRADERHCGCLHESINYSAVLELSVQLRRVVGILGRSPSHHIGSTCLLNQRISDLDTFTANTLSNMITSQEVSLMNQDGSRWNTAMLPSNQLYSLSPHQPSSKVWDVTDPGTPLPCGDSLMSWEPFRRTTCSV